MKQSQTTNGVYKYVFVIFVKLAQIIIYVNHLTGIDIVKSWPWPLAKDIS